MGICIILSAGMVSSCNNCIRGEGEPVTEILELASFDAIHLSGSEGVNISQGLEQRVEIKAPANIIRLLNTEVKNNIWEIAFEKCVRAKQIEIHIVTPTIEKITITGSGNVKSGNNLNVEEMEITIAGSGDVELMLNAREVTTNISGSGDVTLNGSAINHKIDINGSGNVNASDFATVETKVKITGSGDAGVNATELVEAEIAGSGDIKYKDSGARIVSDITGSGDIIKN